MSNHFAERAIERYGAQLTEDKLKLMRKRVVRGESTFLRNSKNDRTIRRMDFEDKTYWFVWNHRSADFVTFLPEGGEDARASEC